VPNLRIHPRLAEGEVSETPIPPREFEPAVRTRSQAERAVATPLEGKTTVDDTIRFECEVLAHRSAAVLAARIAEEIDATVHKRKPCTIHFLDATLALALGLHRTFYQQCDVLGQAFESAAERARRGIEALKDKRALTAKPEAAVLTVGTVLTGALATTANLLSYFNLDTSFFGRSASVTEQVLVMELARRLRSCSELSFRWPSYSAIPTVDTPQNNSIGHTPPLHLLNRIAAKQEDAVGLIHELATEVHRLGDRNVLLPTARLALDRAHEAYDSATAVFAELRETFLSSKEDARASPGFLLQIAADVLRAREEPTAANGTPGQTPQRLFLTARVEVAGGSYRIRRTLFQALKRQDPLTFTGGCIVTFALLDSEGDFLAAGTEWHREPFHDDREVENILTRPIPWRAGRNEGE
jgi:hypothetical protein